LDNPTGLTTLPTAPATGYEKKEPPT